jgi:hypothetical protein
VEGAHAGTIWDEQAKPKWRLLCIQVHARRQGAWTAGCPTWTAWPGSWCRAATRCWRGARASSARPSEATPLGTLQHALLQRFPVVMVDEAYTSKYAYEAEEKLYKVWSDENGKVVRGLLWHEDTTYPEWSCSVNQDQNEALNIHGLLVCWKANRPCHLSRAPGRAKLQVVVGKRILR